MLVLLWRMWEYFFLDFDYTGYATLEFADPLKRIILRNMRWERGLAVKGAIEQYGELLIRALLSPETIDAICEWGKVSYLRKFLIWVFGPAPYWIRMQLAWWCLGHPFVLITYGICGGNPDDMVLRGVPAEKFSQRDLGICRCQAVISLIAISCSLYIDGKHKRKK